MRTTKASSKVVTLRLPEPAYRKLAALAHCRGTTRSAIVREALKSLEAPTVASFATLAEDLIGSIEGPRDLSYASKHLRGYGQ